MLFIFFIFWRAVGPFGLLAFSHFLLIFVYPFSCVHFYPIPSCLSFCFPFVPVSFCPCFVSRFLFINVWSFSRFHLALALAFSSLLFTREVVDQFWLATQGTGCHAKSVMYVGCPCGQSAHVDWSGFFGTWWFEDTTPMSIADVVLVALCVHAGGA